MISQDELKKLVSYDPETGVMTRIKARGNTKAGSEIGSIDKDGYRATNINGRGYLVHRLIWLYVYGKFPDFQIDHINHDRTDNRISNLRDVSIRDNARNRNLMASNTSGCMGVVWHKVRKLWQAQLKIDNKTLYLGGYKDIKDAISARKEAEVIYGFHDNHGKELVEC